MVWEESDKKDPFIPLRLTMRGAAGIGKRYIINTIVSYLGRMFGENDMVQVLTPTGIAAFNVLGYTLNRFAGIDWKIQEKECQIVKYKISRKDYKQQSHFLWMKDLCSAKK
jgi:hypothetical protein